MTVDVAKVVEQPLNVELSLPGELTAFQSVAIYPRVAGFVKAVHVDRGSRVRAGGRRAGRPPNPPGTPAAARVGGQAGRGAAEWQAG